MVYPRVGGRPRDGLQSWRATRKPAVRNEGTSNGVPYLIERSGRPNADGMPDLVPKSSHIVDRPLMKLVVAGEVQIVLGIHVLHEFPHGRGFGIRMTP
jgi:hypothetical protein